MAELQVYYSNLTLYLQQAYATTQTFDLLVTQPQLHILCQDFPLKLLIRHQKNFSFTVRHFKPKTEQFATKVLIPARTNQFLPCIV